MRTLSLLAFTLAAGCVSPSSIDSADDTVALEGDHEAAESRDVTDDLLTHARCSGTECDGRSPDSTGCKDDAYTVGDFTRDSVIVKLKRSDACDTVWTYVERTSGTGYVWAKVKTYDGRVQTASSSSASSIKSGMLSCSDDCMASACGMGSSTASTKCSGWYEF